MKKRISVLLIICMLVMSGCSVGIDLDANESDLVAEFAAGMLIPYSYLYENRYDTWKTKEEETTIPDVEEPTQEPTIEEPTTEPSTDSEGDPVIKPSDENPTQGDESGKDKLELCQVFGTHPVEINYNGYTVVDGYDIAGGLFEITPEHGCKFVVVNFLVHNKSFEDKTIATVDKEVILRAVINETTRCNNYDATVLTNDLTMLKDVTIKSGEKYETVLLFMIPSEVADNIESFVIEVASDMEEEGQLIIK